MLVRCTMCLKLSNLNRLDEDSTLQHAYTILGPLSRGYVCNDCRRLAMLRNQRVTTLEHLKRRMIQNFLPALELVIPRAVHVPGRDLRRVFNTILETEQCSEASVASSGHLLNVNPGDSLVPTSAFLKFSQPEADSTPHENLHHATGLQSQPGIHRMRLRSRNLSISTISGIIPKEKLQPVEVNDIQRDSPTRINRLTSAPINSSLNSTTVPRPAGSCRPSKLEDSGPKIDKATDPRKRAVDTAAVDTNGSQERPSKRPVAFSGKAPPDEAQLAAARWCHIRKCAEPEDPGGLLLCCTCGRGFHARCCDPPLLYEIAMRYPWKCNEDKVCYVCFKTNNEAALLLCDSCDRSFHKWCCSPSVKRVTSGSWFCRDCSICTRCEQLLSTQEAKDVTTFDATGNRCCLKCRSKKSDFGRRQPAQCASCTKPIQYWDCTTHCDRCALLVHRSCCSPGSSDWLECLRCISQNNSQFPVT